MINLSDSEREEWVGLIIEAVARGNDTRSKICRALGMGRPQSLEWMPKYRIVGSVLNNLRNVGVLASVQDKKWYLGKMKLEVRG